MVSEDVQGRVSKRVCLTCNREFTGAVQSCPDDGTLLIQLAQDQLVGTKLADRYLIISVVGHGGMGVVYKARHELMDRIVAIKMLLSQLISDSMSVKRFQREAKAACRLKHPNVITLYDFGISPSGQPYLVMDFLEGVSLADVIKRDGQLGVDRCIRIFSQACEALDHAHHQGVIHRDLKPGNIMLIDTEDEKDFVKVVDFGVAKLMGEPGSDESQRLTQTGEVCGSPVYMSPEQCRGEKLDARSDIYSMGVVIYEVLTGKLPLLGKTMVDTMSKHISELPSSFGEVRPDLYIPPRLEAVVFKALQKNPEDRQQSMAHLGQEIQFAVPKPGKSQSLRTADVSSIPSMKSAPAQSKSRVPAVQPQGLPPAVIGIMVAATVAVLGGVFWFVTRAKSPSPVPANPAVTSPVPRKTPESQETKREVRIHHTSHRVAAPAPETKTSVLKLETPVIPEQPAAPAESDLPAKATPSTVGKVVPASGKVHVHQSIQAQHPVTTKPEHNLPTSHKPGPGNSASAAKKAPSSVDPFEALKNRRSY